MEDGVWMVVGWRNRVGNVGDLDPGLTLTLSCLGNWLCAGPQLLSPLNDRVLGSSGVP